MSVFTNRTSFVGTALFITAMLFTGSAFAQTAATWRIFTFEQTDGGPYVQFAPFCSTGTPCTRIPVRVCLDGNVNCLTTTGNESVDFFSTTNGVHQICLYVPSPWKLVSGSVDADQVPATNCVQKDFNGNGGYDHATAMYLEPATLFSVTKTFTDANDAIAVTVGVTCTNGATATAQGDGTLNHGETQDWLIENITTPTVCTALETQAPAGYTGSLSFPPGDLRARCSSVELNEGDPGSCTLINTLNTDTIRVGKLYTDESTTPVDVTMTCTSGDVDLTGNPFNTKPVAGGSFASFNVTGFNQAADASGQSTTCTITESNLPANYYQVSASQGCSQTMAHQDNAGTCTLLNGPERATFVIEKIWNQEGNTDGIPVTAHLSCTGANQTQQNVVFTATTDAILFVYDINLAQGPVDCTITEDVPDNYVANYEGNCEGSCSDSDQGEDACFYGSVLPYGEYTCTITNRPQPAVITVTKTWVIEGADQGFDGGHVIGGVCDSVIDGPQENEICIFGECIAAVIEEEASSGSTDYEFTIVKPRYPFTSCVFLEQNDDSIVETDNGCGRLRLGAGDDVDCEIVNTVFFEGIPTLNQYGMAILALLMLGVGMIGFRRFV